MRMRLLADPVSKAKPAPVEMHDKPAQNEMRY